MEKCNWRNENSEEKKLMGIENYLIKNNL